MNGSTPMNDHLARLLYRLFSAVAVVAGRICWAAEDRAAALFRRLEGRIS